MGPIWADRPQVGPMLAPWILLSGMTPIGSALSALEAVVMKTCISANDNKADIMTILGFPWVNGILCYCERRCLYDFAIFALSSISICFVFIQFIVFWYIIPTVYCYLNYSMSAHTCTFSQVASTKWLEKQVLVCIMCNTMWDPCRIPGHANQTKAGLSSGLRPQASDLVLDQPAFGLDKPAHDKTSPSLGSMSRFSK